MAQPTAEALAFLSPFKERLLNDTELQGAAVRFGVGIVVAAILPLGMTLGYFDLARAHYLAFFAYFFGLSALFFGHIWRYPSTSNLRPYLSVVFDVTTATLAVAASGSAHSPLYPLYLWICITNGVRFGHRQMVVATLLSIAMLNGLFLLQGVWREHLIHVALYSLFLAIFPLYLGGLMKALHRARRDAESASRAKSEFLANMTHELRTPLVGVVGITSLLQGTHLSDEQRAYVRNLKTSTRTLSRTIDDLLDFSRIEAGCIELARRPFSPAAVVGDVKAIMESLAREKGLRLQGETAPGFPAAVLGDDLRFRQILLNLVGNAVKFTERGEIVIRLFPVEKAAGWVRVRMEIEDTGIGMSEAQLAVIFDRFRQGEGSPSRRYQGTGLGTSIAKRLVDLMGGTISVTSQKGVGTCFRLEIPWQTTDERPVRGPSDSIRAALNPEHGKAAEGATAALKGPILLVEDNPINVMAIATLLEKAGYRVDVAKDAYQALAAKPKAEYALVLTDVQMPGMDGPTLTRRWREEGRGRDTPIVALTASASMEDRELCLNAGMNDFLSKPVETELLLAVAGHYCYVAGQRQVEADGSRQSA